MTNYEIGDYVMIDPSSLTPPSSPLDQIVWRIADPDHYVHPSKCLLDPAWAPPDLVLDRDEWGNMQWQEITWDAHWGDLIDPPPLLVLALAAL